MDRMKVSIDHAVYLKLVQNMRSNERYHELLVVLFSQFDMAFHSAWIYSSCPQPHFLLINARAL
jgi:hypothetical protein